MSIEFLPFDTTRSSLSTCRGMGVPPMNSRASDRRIAANRRNAQRSTGPRTAKGKRRSSRNALKHGLCASTVCLASEDKPTFNLFISELEEELQPRTATQHMLFNELANVIWRLRRLPEAQADLFDHELDHAADGETLSPSQVLARRFSDDSSNGFILLGRYETSLRNSMLRLLRQLEQTKKNRPHTPYARDEQPVPSEGSRPAAPSEEEMRAQQECFARRKLALEHYQPPRNAYEARIDQSLRADHEHRNQTQSNPSQNLAADSQTRKCSISAPVPIAKQTHRAPAQSAQAIGDT